jgi:hypothetical protein
LAVLLKRWLSHTSFSQVHLILVSGRGKPIDQSSQDLDNSTQFTGELVKVFAKLTLEYTKIDIYLIHSETNLFRYDENILFVKRELLPVIHNMRRQIVAQKKDKWRDFMHITLSFADGSSARISAINQSLKIYQPAYMHFWSLKSFWREQKLYDDDVEFHTYEEIATEPAMRLKDLTDAYVIKAVDEIERFHQEFEAVAASKDNDLRSFWLRKTMKAVLAVLIVEKPNGEIVAYRGTNLEVSLPTGSLCAERNAIGTAFASDMSLKREDIKLVAVYSAAYEEKQKKVKDESSPLPNDLNNPSITTSVSAPATSDSLNSSITINSSNANQMVVIKERAVSEGEAALSSPSTRGTLRQVSTNTARTRAILQINDPVTSSSTTTSLSASSPNYSGTANITFNINDGIPTSPMAKRLFSQTHSSPGSLIPPTASIGSSSSSNSVRPPLAPTTSSVSVGLNVAAPATEPRKKRKVVPFSSPIELNSSSLNGSSSNLAALNVSVANGSTAGEDPTPPPQVMSFCSSSADDAAVTMLTDSLLDIKPCEHHQRLATMETIETGVNDLNPLKPCGTCTSWLKKIVKCNPDFRVVTFTDARRQGIYVEYVQE